MVENQPPDLTEMYDCVHYLSSSLLSLLLPLLFVIFQQCFVAIAVVVVVVVSKMDDRCNLVGV